MGGPGSGRKKGSTNRVKSTGPSNSSKMKSMKPGNTKRAWDRQAKGWAKGNAGKGSKISAKVSTSRKLGGKSFKSSKMGKEYKSDSKFRV